MRSAICLTSILTLLLVACEEDKVHVHVRPRADGTFVRTVTMWRVDPAKPEMVKPPSDDLLNGAKAVYGEPEKTEDGKLVFQGVFREMPGDVGLLIDGQTHLNRGGYTIWRCRAGSFAAYRERRPGPTDHWAAIRKVAEGVDVFTGIAAEAAREALAGEEGLGALLAWIAEDFREDLKDLLILLATNRADGEDQARTVLVAQLLEERGYLPVSEMPRVLNAEDGTRAVVDFLARKMGRPGDAELRNKLAGYTEERLVQLWSAALDRLGLSKKEAKAKIEPVVGLVFDFDLGSPDSELSFELELPAGATPAEWSGEWDAEKRTVTWRTRLGSRQVSDAFFATWSAPTPTWQEDHLGGVVLTGRRLKDYVLWVESLPDDQARAWERAVESLKPGPGFEDGLASIRLTPPDPDETEGARILRQALAAAGR